MDLWIYSEDFELLGVVDTASSIIWANRFRQCGDFEIYVQASAAMLDLLQIDRIVARPGDEMACFIEKVEITTDEENGDFMTVSGRCLRSILDRRIVWDQTQLSGTLENGMRKLVTDAFISPAIAARKYSSLTLAAAHGYTETVSAQYTGTNLLAAYEELCATKNYGFKIILERDGWKPGKLGLIVNRAPGGVLDDGVKAEIEKHGLNLLGVLPQDEGVYRCDCDGEPSAKLPQNNPVKIALKGIMQELGL